MSSKGYAERMINSEVTIKVTLSSDQHVLLVKKC